LLCICLAACGYRFSGGGRMPENVQKIAIEVLRNRTGETGIESILTNEIINQFIIFGNAEVTDKEKAEAILSGVIQSASAETVSHQSAYTSAERQVTVRVDIQLTTPGGKVLWSVNGIEASEDYLVSDEKIRTEQNKRSAIANLSQRLAQRIFYQLTDQF